MKISRDCPRHSCVSKSFDWINVVEADHHYFRSTAAELDLREDSIPDTDGMPATARGLELSYSACVWTATIFVETYAILWPNVIFPSLFLPF